MIEAGYIGSWTLGADNATVHNVPSPGPGNIQSRRQLPELGAVRAIRFDGRSNYHALTLRLERPLLMGLALSASYTLSSSMDDASSPGATESEANVPQDVGNIFDETGEWARSSFNHWHLFVASGTYLLSYNFRVSAVFLARSGAPFTVNLATDRANIGAGPAQRPHAIGDANLPGGKRVTDRWFETSAFALPAPFAFGTARRNSVIGPGYATLDLALAKTFRAGRAGQIAVRWGIFNAVNRANLDLPNRIFGSENFGRIFSVKPAREMQVGLRMSF
ncbi:MAG: hypothetical protein IT180_17380 [Acidobacteria bacterium]|nr:hypothetical protein [Acidobacteriota bacterium]